jgi:hypothetical protein
LLKELEALVDSDVLAAEGAYRGGEPAVTGTELQRAGRGKSPETPSDDLALDLCRPASAAPKGTEVDCPEVVRELTGSDGPRSDIRRSLGPVDLSRHGEGAVVSHG